MCAGIIIPSLVCGGIGFITGYSIKDNSKEIEVFKKEVEDLKKKLSRSQFREVSVSKAIKKLEEEKRLSDNALRCANTVIKNIDLINNDSKLTQDEKEVKISNAIGLYHEKYGT